MTRNPRVLVVDARPPRRCQLMAGNLLRPPQLIDVHHDQLLSLGADPESLADQLDAGPSRSHRRPRRLLGDRPFGSPEAQRVRHPRQPVQMLMLLLEQQQRRLAGGAVRTRVDMGDELWHASSSARQPDTPRGGCDRLAPDRLSRSRPSPRCRPCSAGPPARRSESSARSGARPQRCRVAHRDPHTCSTVTVFSLSVSA